MRYDVGRRATAIYILLLIYVLRFSANSLDCFLIRINEIADNQNCMQSTEYLGAARIERASRSAGLLKAAEKADTRPKFRALLG